MFHKANSSLETTKVTVTTPHDPFSKNHHNNKKSGANTKTNNVVSVKKGKDVPLRKSDRRELLQRALEFFGISKHKPIDKQHQKIRGDCDGNNGFVNNDSNNNDAHIETIASSESCTVGENESDSTLLQLHTMLEIAFLHGIVYSRILKVPDGKITMYFRTAVTAEEMESSSTNEIGSSTIFSSQWPFQYSDQCIWIFLDQGSSRDDQYHIPGLALLSTIVPIFVPVKNRRELYEATKGADKFRTFDIFSTSLYEEVLPIVQVHPLVSKYLVRGANLMRAGMRSLPSRSTSSASTISTTSRVLAICIQGNPQPFAVGILHPDVRSLHDIGIGTNGIGVTVISCYGDDIWRQQLLQINDSVAMMKIKQKSFNYAGQNERFFNLIGGQMYDDGHYGNVGFVDGTLVLPIVEKYSTDAEDESDEYSEDLYEDINAQEYHSGIVCTNENEDKDVNGRLEKGAICCNDREIEDGGQAEDTITEHSHSLTVTNTLSTEELKDEEEHATAESNADSKELSQDAILHLSVLAALTQIAPRKKELLPMTIATFYANYVLPNRPPNTTINLKQTKYKKFGNYVVEQSHGDPFPLLKVGAKKGGDDSTSMLLDFEKRHPDFRSFVQNQDMNSNNEISGASISSTNRQHRLVLLDLYVVPHHFVSLLRLPEEDVKAFNATSTERRGTGILTAKEMKEILDRYIERENLVRADNLVQLDGPMTDALYGKAKKRTKGNEETLPDKNYEEVLSQKDIASIWKSKMEPAYALVQTETAGSNSQIIRLGRGKPPMVLLEVSLARSKKYVTRIRGMEMYGVPATVLAKDISSRFACAATLDEKPETNARPALHGAETAEINVQGNWADEVEALLLSDETLSDHGGVKGSNYFFPKNSIKVIIGKGVPQRKKRAAGNVKKK